MAFYGRVACPDDPHTAIHQQLRAVSAALPPKARIIGYFADVGPWNGLRGSIRPTNTWHLNGHPVDGGLIELLDRACRAHRDLDAIACIDLDRLSRRLVECQRIEDDLAHHGVRVLTPHDLAITTLSAALPGTNDSAQPHPPHRIVRGRVQRTTAETDGDRRSAHQLPPAHTPRPPQSPQAPRSPANLRPPLSRRAVSGPRADADGRGGVWETRILLDVFLSASGKDADGEQSAR